jgi:hypothetical protein
MGVPDVECVGRVEVGAVETGAATGTLADDETASNKSCGNGVPDDPTAAVGVFRAVASHSTSRTGAATIGATGRCGSEDTTIADVTS